MVVRGVTRTHEQQADLARRSLAGDRAAYDELALSVWSWVRGKARGYGRKFHVDPDDLEAVGMSRLPYVLRTWSPERGNFRGLFFNAAAREMVEVARKELAKASRTQAEGEEPADRPQTPNQERAEVIAALAKLNPLERRILEGRLGYDGKVISGDRIAAALGMTPRRAERLYQRAFNRISDELNGYSTSEAADGPQPDQLTPDSRMSARTTPEMSQAPSHN